jgi:hypothetical protein
MQALIYLVLSFVATFISLATHSIALWFMCVVCILCVALVGTAETVVALDYDCDEKVLRVNLRG